MTTPLIPHTPSKPINRGAASTGSQRDRRWTDTFYDIHRNQARFPNGRPFTGEREMKSGTEERSESAGFITSDLQCGAYFCDHPEQGQTQQERMDTLASAWSAPWLPLAKYFRFNYRTKRISFAYDKMISDERAGLSQYWDAAAKLAGENDTIDPDHPLKVPFRIRRLIGAPSDYTDKIKIAQAAQAGDPWLLGFVDEPNVELAKMLRVKINFIGGHTSDREYTETRLPETVKPILTPEQVVATAAPDLHKMIADAVAQALAAQEAEKKAAHSAKVKEGLARKKGEAA